MLLGLFAWLVPVVGPLVAAGVIAAVLGGDRPPRTLDYAGGIAVGASLVLVATLVAALAGALDLSQALIATVSLTVGGSLALVYRLDGPGGRWGAALRRRLVLGVPWGTLITSGGVLAVYLFVQGGATAWYSPVTLPFRAWSFAYPLGIVSAPFSHNGPGHLVGNLLSTLVLGSITEYAWGHFPRERGSSSFGSWRTNPLVRAFVIFPAVVVGVGLFTSVTALGPVIGFSGVVFAFAGFALTRYPIWTVVAGAGVGALRLTYQALQDPVVTAQASPSPPSAPWWAQVAIQAHALGLLSGVVLGWYVFARRGDRPSALRLWTAVLLFAVERSLWAVYWFRGEETFVLYRGPGVVLVLLLAALVAVALTASDRPLLERVRDRGGPSTAPERTGDDSDLQPGAAVETDGGRDDEGDDGSTKPDPGPVAEDRDGRPAPVAGSAAGEGGDDDDSGNVGRLRSMVWDDDLTWLTSRTVAVSLLLLGLALLAGPGVGSNVFTVADTSAPGNESAQVEVRDYTVTYAEGVTNQRVAVIDFDAFNETTQVRTSGVIVTSPERAIWQQVVSTGRLAFDGTVTVDLGGPGWRESVTAIRRGWSADGGGTAYKVWLRPENEDRRLAFQSDPATAADTVAGRNLTISPGPDGFFIIVEREDAPLETVSVPATNESVTASGLTLTNREGTIYASVNDTRVKVFTREEYE